MDEEKKLSNRHGRKKELQLVKEQRLAIVAKLISRGYNYRYMREELIRQLNLESYSLSTLKKDIDTLVEEWRKERVDEADKSLQLELQRCDTVETEAWDAWERSKTEKTKTRAKQHAIASQVNVGQTKVTKVEQTKETEQQVGDPRFLDVVYKQQVERRKLLGMYAPEKKELTGKNGSDLIPAKRLTKEEAQELMQNLEKDY